MYKNLHKQGYTSIMNKTLLTFRYSEFAVVVINSWTLTQVLTHTQAHIWNRSHKKYAVHTIVHATFP